MKYMTTIALVGLVALAAPVLADVVTVPTGGLVDGVNTYYVDTADGSVWEETNGHEGLQTAPFCADGSEIVDGLCADGSAPVPADTKTN